MESSGNIVIDAIKSRRSIRRFKDEIPEKSKIEQIIESSFWAPNHYLTQPWRFVVISGEERVKLGEAMASAVSRLDNGSAESKNPRVELERKKVLQAPVLIALICSPDTTNDRVVMQEELVACGAALQNVLLATKSLGLGSWVRTGASSYSEEVKRYLNMKANEFLIGMIYTGYIAEAPPSTSRLPLESKVEWRGM